MHVAKRLAVAMFAMLLAHRAAGQSVPTGYPCDAITDTEYVPSYVWSYISEDATGRFVIQRMYWHDMNRISWLYNTVDSTFELDTIFYNYNDVPVVGAAYGVYPYGYWDSNLPDPYVDVQVGDPNEEKAVTVGCASAFLLYPLQLYYYATRMMTGPGNQSWVKVAAQRGRQVPTGCLSSLCSYSCTTDVNQVRIVPFQDHFTAPGCRHSWYQWWVTWSSACPLLP